MFAKRKKAQRYNLGATKARCLRVHKFQKLFPGATSEIKSYF